jgi:hypothetical protein
LNDSYVVWEVISIATKTVVCMCLSCLYLIFRRSLGEVIYAWEVGHHGKELMEDPWDRSWRLSLQVVVKARTCDEEERSIH